KVDIDFAPSSTVVGATILNAVLAESIKHMADAGFEPPVLLSGNVDGADDHNNALIQKYKDRIKLQRLYKNTWCVLNIALFFVPGIKISRIGRLPNEEMDFTFS